MGALSKLNRKLRTKNKVEQEENQQAIRDFMSKVGKLSEEMNVWIRPKFLPYSLGLEVYRKNKAKEPAVRT